MLSELQTVEDRLAIAQDLRDMQNGPELLRKQRILSEQVREERIELEADLRRREELEAALTAIKEDIEKFEVQRHRMTAEIRALQAQRQAQEIQQQFFTEANNSAVAEIQERLQNERNRADLVTEMLGGSSRQMTNLDRRLDEQEFAAMCRQVDSVAPIQLEKPDFARLPSRLSSVTRVNAS
ncbi:MAG TPA: hypothetical protein DDZ51_08225 [Planctomycetaceae bacterium]|nr:hypothetical protein [Planctomycetaceae bacterium]